MRLLWLGLAGIAVGGVSFVATCWFLGDATGPENSKPEVEIIFKPGMLAAATTGTITPTADGLAIAWQANAGTAKGPLDGIFMHTLFPTQLPHSYQKIRMELEITAGTFENPLVLEAQFIQNDLKMGGWERYVLRPGRQVYVLDYQAPLDTRKSDRVATIWLRPDPEGRGRPVIIHAARLFIE